MKYLKKLCIYLGIFVLLFSNIIYAHSGRTDSNGGHRDNQNKSGLGSYHYHCGGYPAHLHPDGICPYSSNSSSSSTSSNKTETIVSTVVKAESIEINENIEELSVGDSKQLTTTILPNNVTDKKVIWESSDDKIVNITDKGKIIAMNTGNVIITASTSNGITDSIRICVKEKNNNALVTNSATEKNISNTVNNESQNSIPIAGILTMVAIGGGSYWIYKNYKKSK